MFESFSNLVAISPSRVQRAYSYAIVNFKPNNKKHGKLTALADCLHMALIIVMCIIYFLFFYFSISFSSKRLYLRLFYIRIKLTFSVLEISIPARRIRNLMRWYMMASHIFAVSLYWLYFKFIIIMLTLYEEQ